MSGIANYDTRYIIELTLHGNSYNSNLETFLFQRIYSAINGIEKETGYGPIGITIKKTNRSGDSE
jgi:hypothetical protein